VFSETDQLSRQVAEQFFDSRCYVLAGGPGTGKTYTIAKLLAALDRAGVPISDISLCAPTGKAASRMKEAIQDALIATQANPDTIDKINPSTIHVMLSISPQSFKRKSVTALNTKLVICDETSMVDLALLHEMLNSLPPSARIILVGDPNQLQSVDVGSAMLDLIRAHEANILPGTVLEVVHRVDASMDADARAELLEFFQEIRTAKSADRAMSMLKDGMKAVTYIPFNPGSDADTQLGAPLEVAVQRALSLKALANEEFNHTVIKAALNSSMVLTAQHEGDLSRTWWLEKISSGAGFRSLRADQPGLPVLITQSDRANHLNNGDSGLLVASDGGVSFALIKRDPSALLSATVLRHFQAWWAMTIHKSQGSEFENVTVTITPNSRLLSKELFYTAITRAKKHVTVIAVEEDLRHAIESPARRFTGLFEALSAAAKEA
jgi:exodeoxyribonuclease V alpha subunit